MLTQRRLVTTTTTTTALTTEMPFAHLVVVTLPGNQYPNATQRTSICTQMSFLFWGFYFFGRVSNWQLATGNCIALLKLRLLTCFSNLSLKSYLTWFNLCRMHDYAFLDALLQTSFLSLSFFITFSCLLSCFSSFLPCLLPFCPYFLSSYIRHLSSSDRCSEAYDNTLGISFRLEGHLQQLHKYSEKLSIYRHM